MNAVNSVASYAYQNTIGQGTAQLATQVLRNANRIAPLAIATIALANLPAADSGPVSFIACMAACSTAAFFNPALIPLLPTCQMACDLIGFTPTP